MLKSGKRSRAPNACRSCHASKVKCDIATTGGPCTRCKKRGLDDCSTFPSRRGTYDRKEWQKKRQMAENGEVEKSNKVQKRSGATTKADGKNESDIVTEIPRMPTAGTGIHSVNSPTAFSSSSSSSGGAGLSSSMASSEDDPNGGSWEVVVEYFLKKKKSKIKKNSLTYLGESSPFATLLRSGHIQINEGNDDSEEKSNGVSPIDPEMRALEQRGCFQLPKKAGLETFFKNYFENVHPFNPIINRVWFANKYSDNTLSYLLIFSVCFAACYHCPMSAIYEAEFSTRNQAKSHFYSKAKALFDCNYEKDKVVALQSCYLLSFRAGKPSDVWNSRTWLGIAINIAEDLGMHRAFSNTEMHPSDKSHLRIIWWCLCNRDIMSSLTVGRPPKVSLERCDCEALTLDDFAVADEDPGNPIFGSREIEQSFYHMEVSKLTRILHDTFMARCDPRSPCSAELNHSQYQKLCTWRSELPSRVDWDVYRDSIFAVCLRILYHHQVLYIYRPRTSETAASSPDSSLDKSLESASEIALAASKLSMMALMNVPQDIYGSFFMAMAILAMDTKSNLSSNPEASSMQLQICKMVLSQGEGYWDHSLWVIKVFDRFMDQQQNSVEFNEKTPTKTAISPMETAMTPSLGSSITQGNNPDLTSNFAFPDLQGPVPGATDFYCPEYTELFKTIFGNDSI